MGLARLFRRVALLGTAGLLAAFLTAPSASAVVEPGTPVAAAPGVPDQGRAWELVSSPDPTPSGLWPGISLSRDGDVFLYHTKGAISGFEVLPPLYPVVTSMRGLQGWTPSQIPGPVPADRFMTGPQPMKFGPGYETAIWQSLSGTDNRLFLRDRAGEFSPVAQPANYFGASADLQRIVFTSTGHLLPADASRISGSSIYERDGSTLRLLDIKPDGSLISDCGSNVFPVRYDGTGVEGGFVTVGNAFNAVSADARRVYFSSSPACNPDLSRLYLAEGGATTEISASRCTSACGSSSYVYFLSATPNGSSAFLATSDKLTDEDENEHRDLYRYDVEGDRLSLISSGAGRPDLAPVLNRAYNTQPAVWGQEGNSRVYFLGAPAIGPEETGEAGVYLSGDDGVHRLDSTAATVAAVSSGGRYLILNTPTAHDPADTDGEIDTYRYDAEDGSFTRLSTGPAGGNGPFPAAAEAQPVYASESVIAADQPLVAAEDGSRVFFITAERLVAADVNEVDDVYEWAEGKVGLVSAGVGSDRTFLAGSSADGSTVVFATANTLLPRDRDGRDLDFYAARIGGGFPEPASPSDPCPCGDSPSRRQIDGSATASARPGDDKIALGRIDAAARRRMVAGGRIELLVEVPRAGRLKAGAKARIGGRPRTIAASEIRVDEPGPIQLSMPLSRPARLALGQGRDLRVTLKLSMAGLVTREAKFGLGGSR